jgi:hypothetical protein
MSSCSKKDLAKNIVWHRQGKPFSLCSGGQWSATRRGSKSRVRYVYPADLHLDWSDQGYVAFLLEKDVVFRRLTRRSKG